MWRLLMGVSLGGIGEGLVGFVLDYCLRRGGLDLCE